MAGDSENALETTADTTDIPFERTLPGIKPWKRIIVMLAGIFMNIVLALLIYGLTICFNGSYGVAGKPLIVEVNADSPAERCGLKADDIVLNIAFDNGMSLSPDSYVEVSAFTSAYDGNGQWEVTVLRGKDKKTFELTPEYSEEYGRYMIGITFADSYEYVDTNIFNCWKYAIDYIGFVLKLTISAFKGIFSKSGLNNLSGPVGIYSTVAETSSYGAGYYLQLIALLSLNVGVFNALPLPIFDGGRVVLTLAEVVLGRPIDKKMENAIMTACLILLVGMMILVTYNDILKLFR